MDKIEQFWQDYLKTCPDQAGEQTYFAAEAFGDNPRLADELGRLIVQGIKTGYAPGLRTLSSLV